MLAETIRSLIIVAAQMSGYFVPAAEIEVVEVPPVVMHGLACRGDPRCKVLALYQDKNVIFIREDLTPEAKEHVFVHEAVHWLQHHSGKFSLRDDACLDIVAREREAYHVQNRYVAEVQNGFLFSRAPQFTCKTE